MKIGDIHSLTPDLKQWLAKAIAGLITADEAVSDKEIEFLRQAIDFLDHRQDIINIVDMVKKRKEPILTKLEIEKDLASKIMFLLSEIIVVDHKLTQGELEFFRYLGTLLGISHEHSIKIIRWSNDYNQLQMRKKDIIEEITRYQKV